MLNPKKNSYLQLVCAVDPGIINKSVARAMRRKPIELKTEELPPAERLESMQPSLFGPYLDVTMASLGFERKGLRLLNRELHAEDELTQLRAIHTLFDQVHITENAMYLLDLKVTHRLVDLMTHPNHIMRERVVLTLTCLSNYHQGRMQLIQQPIFLDRLIDIIVHDRKEIRYAASLLLKTLSRCRISCEIIARSDKVIESLVQMIQHDHMAIVIFHLNTLKNVSEWNPEKALKANAFQVTKKLMIYHQYRIVQAAMDCMTQLCKHEVGKKLADKYDMTKFLQSFLVSPDLEVIISTVGLLSYTTLTTMSKWRANEFSFDLSRRLVTLCLSHNKPVLQIRAMQVLINLCECPDVRAYVRSAFEKKIIKKAVIRSNEDWETSTYELQSAQNFNTMCIETLDAMSANADDIVRPVEVHSYYDTLIATKNRLLKALRYHPCDAFKRHRPKMKHDLKQPKLKRNSKETSKQDLSESKIKHDLKGEHEEK